MASASGSQHRCVFVGNIPYDATEEQLIQICEEVGPVVSFRLVLDRETGKPKGYGFCEYKDEETALSARRNLQGYEINGRQLRVDFAENDKGADRNREQGRGGPGFTSSMDAQRPLPGAPILGDSSLHQPLGLPLAATAASLMAKTLGGAQNSSFPSVQNNLHNLSGLGNDPLTHYLAKMSKHQLNEIMSEMAMVTQNKALARQLLQGSPQLPKALFQAQIMLGMVTPQMTLQMQMGNNQPSSSSVPKPSFQDNILDQNLGMQSHLGQTPLLKEAVGQLSRQPETQVSNGLQNPVIVQQHIPVQPQFQPPLQPQPQNLIQGTIPRTSGVAIRHQSLGDLSNQPQIPPLPTSKALMSQVQATLLQHSRPAGATNVGHHPQLALPKTSLQQSLLPYPQASQAGTSNNPVLLNGLDMLSREAGRSASFSHDSSWASRMGLRVGLTEQTGMTGEMSELANHQTKRPRLETGAGVHVTISSRSAITSFPTQSISTGKVPGSQMIDSDGLRHSEKQVPQIPPEVETALLQQVMSLTPEQLSSLPLEQQQQVLQLQQMLALNQKV